MVTSQSILIATTNKGKLREVREILSGLPVELATLDAYPNVPDAVEDADTFEGNAAKKALHYAALCGGWTLADDSGLVVDALGGEPGVYSARYAGPDATDSDNNAKLIAALADVPPEERTARFCCAVALADVDGVLASVFGTVEGVIVDEPHGDNGFGYDPHFFVPTEGMTTAQMQPELKNRISHRGQAFRAVRPKIEALLAS